MSTATYIVDRSVKIDLDRAVREYREAARRMRNLANGKIGDDPKSIARRNAALRERRRGLWEMALKMTLSGHLALVSLLVDERDRLDAGERADAEGHRQDQLAYLAQS